MIKLSKNNTFFWSRFFAPLLIIVHVFFIACALAWNILPFYLTYGIFAFVHFGIAKIWRYLLIKEVYLDKDLKQIVVTDLNNNSIRIDCEQIVKQSTYFGITDITITDKGIRHTKYFMPNSKQTIPTVPVNNQ